MALIRHYRFSLAEYERLHNVGILTDRTEVELLEGQVIEPAPHGAAHASMVRSLVREWAPVLGREVLLSVRDPLRLPGPPGGSELRPDLALLRYREGLYADGHPGPDDVLLLVEVADLSLAYDRLVKIPLYGSFGVREAWVVDIEGARIWAHREPVAGGGYASTLEWTPDEAMIPEALPDLALDGERLWAAAAGAPRRSP